MSLRGRWLIAALIPAAWIAYQWIVHGLLTNAETPTTRFALAALNGAPHAALNLLLLWFFGRTLRPGREALITGFARRVHGTLPPYIETYTRQATAAWCVFFAAQVVVSLLLLAAAPLDAWSFFVNVLSCPLIALMFVAEYVYRIVRFPRFSHVSIWRGISLFLEQRRPADQGRPQH